MSFYSSNFSFRPLRVLNDFCINALRLLIIICTLVFAQEEVQICLDVHAPIQGTESKNCSLVCSLKFEHAVSNVSSDEKALCRKNSSLAVFCANQRDCRQYHTSAYCKMIPCLCRAKSDKHETYIFDPHFGVRKISTCVVSTKYMNPDQPIIPFPWKTLLIVFCIVFAFAGLLFCLRWISPFVRSMHAKRTRRRRQRPSALQLEDNTSLFSSVNQTNESTSYPSYCPPVVPRIYNFTPHRSERRHRSSSRARYTSCAQVEGNHCGTLSNEDKPPPYETAIQLPPPDYEDVERAINERRIALCSSRETHNERIDVHVPLESTTQVLSHVSN